MPRIAQLAIMLTCLGVALLTVVYLGGDRDESTPGLPLPDALTLSHQDDETKIVASPEAIEAEQPPERIAAREAIDADGQSGEEEAFMASLSQFEVDRLRRHGEGKAEYEAYRRASDEHRITSQASLAWQLYTSTSTGEIRDEAQKLASTLPVPADAVETQSRCEDLITQFIVDLREASTLTVDLYPDLESGLNDPSFTELAQRRTRAAEKITQFDRTASTIIEHYERQLQALIGPTSTSKPYLSLERIRGGEK